ncbi:MAG: hypothetical protein JXA78_06990 [Anaerolineales bacterium]|nr:hypothetical protein [Anaerolineales bacterium]
MHTKTSLALIVLALLLIGGLGLHGALAQLQGEKYFEETGHSVSGEFYMHYFSIQSYDELYGFPITDVFTDATTGHSIQYFQKARFELIPEAPFGQRIRRAPLGEYLYEANRPFPIPENSPGCRTFPDSSFQVCYAFREFFEANGGEEQLGYPISNIESLDDGRMVQYFQQARLEWLPSSDAEQRVVLADLGYQYFYLRGENPRELLPAPGGDTNEGVIELQVRAYPIQAVTTAQSSQTVHVIVQDQRLLPVRGARVVLNIHMPSGETLTYPVDLPTNDQGITSLSFPVISQSIGIVEIEALASHDEYNLNARTVTSFRIWW